MVVSSSRLLVTFFALQHIQGFSLTRAFCLTDLGCSLNGVCQWGKCICDPPWKDSEWRWISPVEHCSVLKVAHLPDDYIPAYGGGPHRKSTAWYPQQALTSWGGNMIYDKNDQKYHLFVSAMSRGQGLQAWMNVSEIHHATAEDPLQQFKKRKVVRKKEAHNASPIRTPDGTWLIFYMGKNVNQTRRAHVAASDSVDGPWRNIPFDISINCTTPAPVYAPNNTLYCVCSNHSWVIFKTEDVFSGQWHYVTKIEFPSSWGASADRIYLKNEDPYLYFDSRGNWHLLCHRYDYRNGFPFNPNATKPLLVSGHAYSRNGFEWHFNRAQQPYDAVIRFDNGTTQHFSTFERPHLVFGSPDGKTATHLVVAAQPYYRSPETLQICGGCEARIGSASSCVTCKVSSSLDYTFTMVLPLAVELNAMEGK